MHVSICYFRFANATYRDVIEPKKKSLLIYVASLLLFGTNGIVAAAIPLQSTQIVMLRTLIGAPLIVVFAYILKRRGESTRPKNLSRQVLYIVASGVCTGLSWVTLYEAYNLIGVGISSLEYYCAPVIVVVTSIVLFKEKLCAHKATGFALTLLGTFIIGSEVALEGGSVIGLVLGAASALCHAGMVIFSKQAPDITGAISCATQLVLSFLMASLFVAATSGFSFIAEIPLNAWPFIVFLGLANTGLGCLMYFTAILRLPAQTVATLGYLEPLSAVVFAAMLLGEGMSVFQWTGAAMVIIGSIVSEKESSLLRFDRHE